MRALNEIPATRSALRVFKCKCIHNESSATVNAINLIILLNAVNVNVNWKTS